MEYYRGHYDEFLARSISHIKHLLNNVFNEVSDEISIQELSGGFMNKLYLCVSECLGKVIVRINGSATTYIDRKRELDFLINLSRSTLAAPVYASFQNGLIYGYVEGCVLSANQLYEEPIYRGIIKWIIKLQKLDVPQCDKFQPMCLDLIQRYWETIEKQEDRSFAWIEAEIAFCRRIVEDLLARYKQVFCHNDLRDANLLLKEDGSLQPIDWEFAGFNLDIMEIAIFLDDFEGFHPTREFCETFLAEYANVSDKNYDDRLWLDVQRARMVFKFQTFLWCLVHRNDKRADFSRIADEKHKTFQELKAHYG